MGKNQRRKAQRQYNAGRDVWCNFVVSSGGGCHVAHGKGSWVIDTSDFDPEEWDDPEAVPDLSLDPETMLLTAINITRSYKSYFITFPYPANGKRNQPLQMGTTVDENGKTTFVITLIVILEPKQVMDLCVVQANCPMEEIDLFSDIKELPQGWTFNEFDNLALNDFKPAGPYRFPLLGEQEILCSQGNNGGFTHFYPQTKYAVDLECTIGTVVVAVADGIVMDITQSNKVSGIHAHNLFAWNSITLKLDDGKFVEYVHIKEGSVCVEIGERVVEGQEICKSGNIGFCPTPHLHIQFHESNDSNAPTIPFMFKDTQGNGFCPVAGQTYHP